MFFVSLVFFLASLAFAALGFYLVVRLLWDATSTPEPSGAQAPTRKKVYFKKTLHFFKKKLGQYGYFFPSALQRTFDEALLTMDFFSEKGKNRYSLPWVFVLGSPQCGKTSFVKSMALDPLYRLGIEKNTGCHWYFYDNGVVLDVRGDMLNTQDISQNAWHSLLYMLVNKKPLRPIDSIVFMVSCKDLMENSLENNAHQARFFFHIFQDIHRILGVYIPLYLVVTKCDMVAGFSSFCQEIPEKTRHDIFGWSSPHGANQSFSPHWCNEIFLQIKSQIIRLQQEIFVEGHVYGEREGVCLFPYEFQKLQQPLAAYLSTFFNSNNEKTRHPCFLRGVYFSGIPSSLASFSPASLEQAFHEALSPLSKNVPSVSIPAPLNVLQVLPSRPPYLPPTAYNTPYVYFATDLIEKKVFPEKGLVGYTSSSFFHAKSLRFLQHFLIGYLGFSFVGLVIAFYNLQEGCDEIIPNLKRIDQVVEVTLQKQNASTNATDKVFFETQAQTLLSTLSSINALSLVSFFMPFSWFSSLSYTLEQLLGVAYDRIILVALSNKLHQQVKLLIQGKTNPLDERVFLASPSGEMNPLATDTFRYVTNYVNRLHNLQLIAEKLNSLPYSNSTKDLEFIVFELFGFRLPKEFYLNTNIYQRALSRTTLSPFHFDLFVTQATTHFQTLYKSFLNTSLVPEKLSPDLSSLMLLLKNLSHQKKEYAYHDLVGLAKALSRTIFLLNHPSFSWVARDTFNPGQDFTHFLEKISSCSFFDSSTIDFALNQSNKAFHEFKITLSGYHTPFTGPLFVLENNTGQFSSQALLRLQGFLNLLFSESFMKKIERIPLEAPPRDSFLIWRYNSLSEAIELIKSYEKFLNNKIVLFPEAMWDAIKHITFKSLRRNVEDSIARAQKLIPQGRDLSVLSPEEGLLPEAQGLRSSIGLISTLLLTLKTIGATEIYGSFKKIVVSQALSFLEKLDGILEIEQPYRPRTDTLRLWRGDAPSGAFYAFQVHSIQELRHLLTTQRHRLEYLTKEFADPFLKILQQTFSENSNALPDVYLKWRNIAKQLNLYRQSSPDNTLAMLENFILLDLTQATFQNFSKPHKKGFAPSSDFFLQKRQSLHQAVNDQCQGVLENASHNEYKKLATFFNQRLSGLFPFVRGFGSLHAEADLKDIQSFYAQLDQSGDLASRIAQEHGASRNAPQKALKFLEDMVLLRPLFQRMAHPPHALDVEIFLRSHQDKEINGQTIVEWSLALGNNQYTLKHPSPCKGSWSYGAPIKLILTWAQGSPIQPLPLQYLGNPFITSSQATFEYKGRWALLRLLREQGVFSSLPGEVVPQSIKTLQFEIPTTLKSSDFNLKPLKNFEKTLVFSDFVIKDFPPRAFPVQAPPLAP